MPRRINLLADRALLGAYSQGHSRVEKRTVEQAAREVFGAASPAVRRRRSRLAWGGLGAVGLLALGAVAGAWLWTALPALRSAAAPVAALPAAASASAASAAAAASAASTAVSTALAASAAASAAVAADPPETDPADLLAAAHADAALAWRELALRWNVAIGEGDPCVAAQQAQLACHRSASGGLAGLRQAGRPAALVLQPPRGIAVHAVLVSLTEDRATLQAGAQRHTIALATLLSVWRGEFSTFWRMPPGWRDGHEVASAPRPASGWTPAGRRRPRRRIALCSNASGLPACPWPAARWAGRTTHPDAAEPRHRVDEARLTATP